MPRLVAILFALSIALRTEAQTGRASTPESGPGNLEVQIYNTASQPPVSRLLPPAFLASLPQVSLILEADENFPELPAQGVRVTGVELDTLLQALLPNQSHTVAVAICRDGYTSPFPRQAIDNHHPILVLTMDGLSPNAWAAQHHTYDPSPYFVVYPGFVPSFHIFAHEDRPQHPAEIVRLKVFSESQLFAAITPPNASSLSTDSPAIDGFRIAQQNCFRCHNSGETGGTKAHRTWQRLSSIAKDRPDFFAAWVQNPQSIDPQSKMTPNLKYDRATLQALTRYFQTFAP